MFLTSCNEFVCTSFSLGFVLFDFFLVIFHFHAQPTFGKKAAFVVSRFFDLGPKRDVIIDKYRKIVSSCSRDLCLPYHGRDFVISSYLVF